MKHSIIYKTCALAFIATGYIAPSVALADCSDANALAIAALPMTINTNGSYCLKTASVSAAEGVEAAIYINDQVTDVVIDLNYESIGEISGNATDRMVFLDYGNTNGAPTDHLNITVKNGSIRGFLSALQLVANSNGAANVNINTLNFLGMAEGIEVANFTSGILEKINLSFADKTIYSGISGFIINNSQININDVAVDMQGLQEVGSPNGATVSGFWIYESTVSLEGATIFGMLTNPEGVQDFGVYVQNSDANVSGVQAYDLNTGISYEASTGLYRFNSVNSSDKCYINLTKKYPVKHYANSCN